VKALGYAPNMLARSLVNRRSNTLGVVTSGLELFGPSRTLSGIERQANEYGYGLLLNLIHDPADANVMSALTALTARRVDGLIWAVPEISNNRAWVTRALVSRLPPTVFLSMASRPRLRVVAIDNRAGASLAVQHLLDRGRRVIGLIAGPSGWWEARERRVGWQETVRLAGRDTSQTLIVEGDWSAASGERGLRELLARRPDVDAVFVSNDQMALGVLRVAPELGRRVPGDLAVVGFDNIPESAYFTPSLTTVSDALVELGRFAVKKLQRVIDGAPVTTEADRTEAELLRPALNIRESA
jgi:LacI family transcriptional regulator